MEVPKSVRCEFIAIPEMAEGRICQVDEKGWGSCGDAIVSEDGKDLCLWIEEVLEWQDIEPVYLRR